MVPNLVSRNGWNDHALADRGLMEDVCPLAWLVIHIWCWFLCNPLVTKRPTLASLYNDQFVLRSRLLTELKEVYPDSLQPAYETWARTEAQARRLKEDLSNPIRASNDYLRNPVGLPNQGRLQKYYRALSHALLAEKRYTELLDQHFNEFMGYDEREQMIGNGISRLPVLRPSMELLRDSTTRMTFDERRYCHCFNVF